MTKIDRIFKVIDECEAGNQRKFAAKIGITASYVSKLKNDRNLEPSSLMLDKVATAYGANRNWLETGEGEPFPEPSIGDAMGELAAASAQNNVEAVRKFFRELGDEFTDAEILFLYQIYKNHFGKKE